MGTILLFLVAGILLISAEILIPGMIVGIAGGICLIISFALAFDEFGALGASFFAIGAMALTITIVFFEFKLLPKTKMGRKFFLMSVSGGKSETEASPDVLQEDLVGQRGEALSALAPSGLVLVNGKSYEAMSQDGFLSKGDDLEVAKQDKFRVFVRKI